MSSAPEWASQFERILQDRPDDDGSHDIAHVRRVWRLTQDIAAYEGGDLEILVAAAWFHDLVNLPKGSAQRTQASALSAEASRPILQACGFPDSKLDAVYHAIEAHSFSANRSANTLEARILQDADRLDALGAIGIARSFYVAGRMGSKLFDAQDPLACNRELNDRAFALDHFEAKLYRVAETLNTTGAQRIAVERVSVMRAFVRSLMAEIQPEDNSKIS